MDSVAFFEALCRAKNKRAKFKISEFKLGGSDRSPSRNSVSVSVQTCDASGEDSDTSECEEEEEEAVKKEVDEQDEELVGGRVVGS